MSLPEIIVNGRAVADATEGYDRNGRRFMFVRVAASKSRKTDQNEWETVNQIFLDVQWFNAPDNVVAPEKGDAVKVVGELYQELEEYEGQKRMRVRVNAWGMRVFRKSDQNGPSQSTPQVTPNTGYEWTGQAQQPQQPQQTQQPPQQQTLPQGDSPWPTQDQNNPPF
ncbi:hypothetical protein WU87_03275 [Corynebacterium minutissimum]|uniref:Uncharacterized protein n=1 Tax=Corynebacterium minutissimum TaxID=38301 RepID=A0ACC4UCJ1_9CORY|nr:hypothetical protein WU87_03275 [Corynebacterium minutissimum]